MSNLVAVVRLDNPECPVGPATVLEVTSEPVSEVLKRYADRDGARKLGIRFWQGSASDKAGDRVKLRDPNSLAVS
jgi:hypothetical protein